MGTVLLILLLLALCGFIAYVGDLLGRRLGKKRLSVFGLRPKHTAIVLTIFTGVLIAAFTFGAAVATLPWFRSVVTQGERLASQNATLQDHNRTLERAIRERAEANEALEVRSRELTEVNERLRGENRSLQGTNRRLDADNRSLQESYTVLKQASSRLLAQNSNLKEQNSNLQGRNNELTAFNRKLEQERRDLDGQVQDLRQEVDRYRAGEYLYRRGQALATARLLANSPSDVVRRQMASLSFQAERRVEADFESMSLVIEYVPPLRFPAGRPTALRSYQEWIVSQVRRIQDEDIVVQLVAVENCVPGRPLKLRYEWYVNSLVIRQNDELGSRLVDGAAAEGDILEELVFFLQMQVAPTVSSPPYSMSPISGDVGELRYNRLLPVVREIKEKNRWVEVVAVARQDTRRAGPLHLDFEVRDVAPELLGARLQSRPPGR